LAWVETEHGTFRARHGEEHARDARRVLESLELTRARLAEHFPRRVDEITVILHGGVVSLTMTNPALPAVWLMTAPAARRYVAGWGAATELHMLAPAVLRARASGVSGSREMLALSGAALYARRVIVENIGGLRGVMTGIRLRRELRWAWLLEGTARWFSGQTDYARPAIGRRLHEGSPPRFPPGVRDAALLGGTVIDLLVREEGEQAAAALASRLDPRGPGAALTEAFGGRSLHRTEDAWRSHLRRLAGTA
jgi:hypothetical protein